MNITKALADEHRLRVLLALRGGELCACQITELFGLAPSTMSKHLSVLYRPAWSNRGKRDVGFISGCRTVRPPE